MGDSKLLGLGSQDNTGGSFRKLEFEANNIIDFSIGDKHAAAVDGRLNS